jgi:hypothetical protein
MIDMEKTKWEERLDKEWRDKHIICPGCGKEVGFPHFAINDNCEIKEYCDFWCAYDSGKLDEDGVSY